LMKEKHDEKQCNFTIVGNNVSHDYKEYLEKITKMPQTW